MAPVNGNHAWRSTLGNSLILLAILVGLAVPVLLSQSSPQTPAPPPANPQPAQDIPDAPSTVQPPAPKPALPASTPSSTRKKAEEFPFPGDAPQGQQTDQDQQAPPPMPPVETVPAGTTPRNQLNPEEDLYKIIVRPTFVQIPVMVKDSDGRRVDGLLPKDFTVRENGVKQTLTFFTSDPFQLSAAIVIDLGVHDVTMQKVNQTYSSLIGAFSPYDEVALYTYSSTVRQVTDFTSTSKPEKLTAALNELKLVRGRNNGPPVLSGPFSAGPPMVNGMPVGGPPIPPVSTPPREDRVLNDAILRAALDLRKRDRGRRKVIFVVSDGQELGSTASYREVLRLLLAQGIQVDAVAVGSSAMPVYNRLARIHLKGQGYGDLLPKYTYATGGGEAIPAGSVNAIEDAYAQLASEARNQYTLGYAPKAVTGGSAYRSIEVLVDKKGLKVTAKDGYYPLPAAK